MSAARPTAWLTILRSERRSAAVRESGVSIERRRRAAVRSEAVGVEGFSSRTLQPTSEPISAPAMNTATTPKAMRPTLRPGRVNAYSRRRQRDVRAAYPNEECDARSGRANSPPMAHHSGDATAPTGPRPVGVPSAISQSIPRRDRDGDLAFPGEPRLAPLSLKEIDVALGRQAHGVLATAAPAQISEIAMVIH